MVGYKYKSMIITRVPPNNTESSNAAVANKVIPKPSCYYGLHENKGHICYILTIQYTSAAPRKYRRVGAAYMLTKTRH